MQTKSCVRHVKSCFALIVDLLIYSRKPSCQLGFVRVPQTCIDFVINYANDIVLFCFGAKRSDIDFPLIDCANIEPN